MTVMPVFSKDLGNESEQVTEVDSVCPSGSVPLSRGRCC